MKSEIKQQQTQNIHTTERKQNRLDKNIEDIDKIIKEKFIFINQNIKFYWIILFISSLIQKNLIGSSLMKRLDKFNSDHRSVKLVESIFKININTIASWNSLFIVCVFVFYLLFLAFVWP